MVIGLMDSNPGKLLTRISIYKQYLFWTKFVWWFTIIQICGSDKKGQLTYVKFLEQIPSSNPWKVVIKEREKKKGKRESFVTRDFPTKKE